MYLMTVFFVERCRFLFLRSIESDWIDNAIHTWKLNKKDIVHMLDLQISTLACHSFDY